MRKYLMTVWLLFFVSAELFSQKTIKEYEREGDKYFAAGKYYPAINSYWKALSFDTTNASLSYKYAQALSKSLNFCKAVKWYEKALKADTFARPLCLFELAVARKNCGDYTGAMRDFMLVRKYETKIAQLYEIRNETSHEIKYTRFAIKHKNDTVSYTVEHLPAPVNSPYSEFNPVAMPGSKLVFSAYQPVFTDSFNYIFSQAYVSKIKVSSQSQAGWSVPKDFDGKINDSRRFTANICFDKTYRKAYFTKCYDSQGRVGRCSIYFSEKKKGKWTKAQKLPEVINAEGSSSTQPFYAEGQDYDLLFFVSDRKGGYGKTDIWYSVVKDGEYHTPSNLGNVINTEGNEMTPYYDTETQTLYFSSDWHEGFGGFDIFRSQGSMNQWEKPLNMGLPVNSQNNDLYYRPFGEGQEAYLSSNRLGSFVDEGTTYCCSDIYYVQMINRHKKDTLPADSTPTPPSVERKIKKLLPITLYFDNDIPDPKSTSDTTLSDYKTLLDTYFKQRKNYEKNYSRGLKGKAKREAVDTIDDFFDNAVGAGFRKLNLLVQLLKSELDSGKNVRIKVTGYASPLNTAEYNYHLSKRRIASLINYLYSVDNGYFVPYFHGKSQNGGRLTIYQDPRGDKNAAPYVSDNPNDKRNSVYSKAAALERRIQITEYNSGANINKASKRAVLSGIAKKYEAGSIKKGQVKTGIITFKNSGKADLQILDIKSTCACVQLQMRSMLFAPGSTGNIYFMIKSGNLNKGQHKVPVVIRCNPDKTVIKTEIEFFIE